MFTERPGCSTFFLFSRTGATQDKELKNNELNNSMSTRKATDPWHEIGQPALHPQQ